MADAENKPIPEGVFWYAKDMLFVDAAGQHKGGRFFDAWKDRRDEFPVFVKTAKEPVKRRGVGTEAVVEKPSIEVVAAEEKQLAATQINDPIVDQAKRWRKRYVACRQVGFTEDEALKLCTME